MCVVTQPTERMAGHDWVPKKKTACVQSHQPLSSSLSATLIISRSLGWEKEVKGWDKLSLSRMQLNTRKIEMCWNKIFTRTYKGGGVDAPPPP